MNNADATQNASKSPHQDVFNLAMQSLPSLTLNDRMRVLDMLEEETLKASPSFGKALGLELAADNNHDLVTRFIRKLHILVVHSPEATFEFAKRLSQNATSEPFKEDTEKRLIEELSYIAKTHPVQTTALLQSIVEDQKYANTSFKVAHIAGQFVKNLSQNPEALQSAFTLFKKMAAKHSRYAKEFFPALILMKNTSPEEASDMVDIICGYMNPDLKESGKADHADTLANQYELRSAIAYNLERIVQINPSKAFALFDMFVADIQSDDKNKKHLALSAASKLGSIAHTHPEMVFTTLERLGSDGKLSYDFISGEVVRPLVKADAPRILRMLERFLAEKPEHNDRGVPELLVALSEAKSQNADYRHRLFIMAENLLEHAEDDYTVLVFSDALSNIRGLTSEKREKLASMAFNHVNLAKSPTDRDKVRMNVGFITNKPAEEALKPVSDAFAQIGLKFS